MRAVVLVGGEGSRLRPLTLTRPKQMLPVGGRPMIEHVVDALEKHGVGEAVLSLGYRPDAFTEAYPGGRIGGVSLHYAVEPEPLDTAGAVRFAAMEARIEETFLVVNGDVLTDLDVTDLVRFHRERGAEATIALTPVDEPSRFGVVQTDAAGRVLAFIEKPPPEESPCKLINAGTYVMEPSALRKIPGGRRVSIERETFQELVAEGGLYAVASDARWLDVGTPSTYLAANLEHASAEAPPSAALAPGAVVKDSVVSAGVCVGPRSLVEGSVLLEGAVVGAGAEVRDSIVGAGATVGDGARLSGVCVVGDGACVSPGARLHGKRLPEPA